MSHQEHLIENAIDCVIANYDFEVFASKGHNQEMAAFLGINLADVWEMAEYVVRYYIRRRRG